MKIVGFICLLIIPLSASAWGIDPYMAILKLATSLGKKELKEAGRIVDAQLASNPVHWVHNQQTFSNLQRSFNSENRLLLSGTSENDKLILLEFAVAVKGTGQKAKDELNRIVEQAKSQLDASKALMIEPVIIKDGRVEFTLQRIAFNPRAMTKDGLLDIYRALSSSLNRSPKQNMLEELSVVSK